MKTLLRFLTKTQFLKKIACGIERSERKWKREQVSKETVWLSRWEIIFVRENDGGLMLEMSAIDTLNGGQITVPIQLIKLNYLAIRRRKQRPKPRLFFSLRCYLVDNLANLVTDPDFLLASTTDAREYERVSLGRKEGDVMKLLVTKHKFFVPNQRVDFQGICSVSPYAPKVCPY